MEALGNDALGDDASALSELMNTHGPAGNGGVSPDKMEALGNDALRDDASALSGLMVPRIFKNIFAATTTSCPQNNHSFCRETIVSLDTIYEAGLPVVVTRGHSTVDHDSYVFHVELKV